MLTRRRSGGAIGAKRPALDAAPLIDGKRQRGEQHVMVKIVSSSSRAAATPTKGRGRPPKKEHRDKEQIALVGSPAEAAAAAAAAAASASAYAQCILNSVAVAGVSSATKSPRFQPLPNLQKKVDVVPIVDGGGWIAFRKKLQSAWSLEPVSLYRLSLLSLLSL